MKLALSALTLAVAFAFAIHPNLQAASWSDNLNKFLEPVTKSLQEATSQSQQPAKEASPVPQKPVSEFDVYGMKLGMTEKELTDLFPNAKMTAHDPGRTGTYLGKRVSFTLNEGTTFTDVNVVFADKAWGPGAILIEYDIRFKGTMPPNYADIRRKVFEKYGPAQENDVQGLQHGKWHVFYGRCNEDIKTYDFNKRIAYYECGQGLHVEINRMVLRFRLIDTCPRLKYEKDTQVKATDVKF